jgi:hypothetical protein
MQKTVFLTSLLGGLGLAGTIYFVLFDRLSETLLVQLSGLWFLPFVFGFYGLLARSVAKSPEQNPSGAVETTTPIFGLIVKGVAAALPPIISIGLLLLFCIVGLPLFFVKSRKPFVIASIGVGLWAPVLVLFLVFIFPEL